LIFPSFLKLDFSFLYRSINLFIDLSMAATTAVQVLHRLLISKSRWIRMGFGWNLEYSYLGSAIPWSLSRIVRGDSG
jgi:hypothetical protein